MLPSHLWKPWRERIRHFTWAWWAVIMGTGVLSSLANLFPFGNGGSLMRGLTIFFFAINLGLFFFVLTCTIARYYMFPEVFSAMIRHPAQSLFVGCFAMGSATLINSGLVINQEFNFGGVGFLYFIWAMWWLDSALSFIIAFGMLYAMMTRQEHSVAKMTAVWLLPFVTLIVASSSGGNMAAALKPHNTTLSFLSGAFAITMVIMGLTIAVMLITIYLLRLIVHGPPEPALVLSAFLPLGPLGQGGYSLLVAGSDLSILFGDRVGDVFPNLAITGDALQICLFCGAFVLWSMGIAWILIAFMTIFEVARKNKLPFGMAYWGLIFPHGVFAMLSVQMGRTLDSMFFKVFGALWSIGVLALWVVVFMKSIPVFIDGSLFKAPYLSDAPPPPPPPAPSDSMLAMGMGVSVLDIGGYTPSPGTTPTKYPPPGDQVQYIYPGTDAKYLSHNADMEAQMHAGLGMDMEKVIPMSNSTSIAPSEKSGGLKSRPQSVHMTYAKSLVGI